MNSNLNQRNQNWRSIRSVAAAAGVVLLVSPLSAMAQSSNGNGTPTAAEIVEALTPKKTAKTRSFRRTGKSRGIKIDGQLPKDVDLPTINLTINFEFDSANLTNDGIIALRSLGTALQNPGLESMRFQVAGHTDDVGSPTYNMTLSERRAQTVVQHLTAYHNIEYHRLAPVGYGETRPAVAGDPRHPLNRRVQIFTIVPGS